MVRKQDGGTRHCFVSGWYGIEVISSFCSTLVAGGAKAAISCPPLIMVVT